MTSPRAPRGFALMTPERRKEIAAKGGAVKGRKGLSAMSSDRKTEIQVAGNEIRWRRHREKKLLTPEE